MRVRLSIDADTDRLAAYQPSFDPLGLYASLSGKAPTEAQREARRICRLEVLGPTGIMPRSDKLPRELRSE